MKKKKKYIKTKPKLCAKKIQSPGLEECFLDAQHLQSLCTFQMRVTVLSLTKLLFRCGLCVISISMNALFVPLHVLRFKCCSLNGLAVWELIDYRYSDKILTFKSDLPPNRATVFIQIIALRYTLYRCCDFRTRGLSLMYSYTIPLRQQMLETVSVQQNSCSNALFTLKLLKDWKVWALSIKFKDFILRILFHYFILWWFTRCVSG